MICVEEFHGIPVEIEVVWGTRPGARDATDAAEVMIHMRTPVLPGKVFDLCHQLMRPDWEYFWDAIFGRMAELGQHVAMAYLKAQQEFEIATAASQAQQAPWRSQ